VPHDEAVGGAFRQAQEDLQATEAGRPQCGGGQPQVIEERTVEFSNLGGLAGEGRTLKIKYQGDEVNAQKLDEIQRTFEEVLTNGGRTQDDDHIQRNEVYNALCRGEEVMYRDLSKLTCRYRSPNLPYNAWREEIVVRDPMVSIVYNFMTDAEMDELKERSYLQLTRAMAGRSYIEERVQSTSWHPDNSSASLRRLSARVSLVTGLNAVESAEMWQVGQYGIGGYYAPHYDYHADRFSMTSEAGGVLGDRIATWMVYLSDVTAGGFTVFPKLGAWVQPVRGAALFWHNYERAGEQDSRTLHAACPLLMGHKWVANKWIHMRGNELLRPCGRTRAVSEYHVHGI
jgi:prolyl 4-hydroxylase